MRSLLIITPAYNEARYLRRVLYGLKLDGPEAEFVVVDDGSQDATAAVAAGEGATVLSLPYHAGYGAALQTGIKYALRHGYRRAVTFDADGQHEPRSIAGLLRTLDAAGADMVVGSRYLEGSYRAGFWKKAAVRFFAFLARLGSGCPITDPTSGFRAYNERAMRFYATDRLPDTFPDADALIMAHKAGLKITECPVQMYPQEAGKVSMHSGVRAFFYVFNMIFSIMVTMLRRDRMDLSAPVMPPAEELSKRPEPAPRDHPA